MSPAPHQLLWEARQLAEKHNLYIVEVQDVVNHQPVTAYVVYRKAPNGAQNARLGKRHAASALLSLVRHLAGIAA